MFNVKTAGFYFLTDFSYHAQVDGIKVFVFHRIYCIIIKSFFCAVVFFGLGFMVLFQIQHTNKQKVSMTKTVASV